MPVQGFNGLTVAAFESRMAADMTRLIERTGGTPLVAPAMREIPLENNADALRFGQQFLAGTIHVLILMTGVGTKALVEVLQTQHQLSAIKAAFTRTVLVARGPKPVAALKELGLAPTFTVPEPNTWRDIVHTLDERKPVQGLHVAIQEYGVPSHELVDALRQRHAQVTRVPVYRWALPEDTGPLKGVLDAIVAGRVDVLLITNAAQVEHVMQVLPNDQTDRFKLALRRMVIGSIGPTASERLRRHGWPVDLEPSHPKMGILIKEMSAQARALLTKKRSA